ncbi:MAG: DUF4387 domain-containing protein [Thermoleophilia bacterium]|nr:DUF4387 domain-containing protein [Thermoleophilia bacterium]
MTVPAIKIADLLEKAVVIRTKNAGPFMLTIDIFFDDEAAFEALQASGLITQERIAEAYRVPPASVEGIHFVPAVLGLKITLMKPAGTASGELACRDVFGAQQHIPLWTL